MSGKRPFFVLHLSRESRILGVCLKSPTEDLPLPSAESDIQANWQDINERVSEVCGRAGRLPSEITIVAVTKTHPPETTRKACALGIRHIGENRVQEAVEKYSNSIIHELYQNVTLHLLGHLQRNKVRKALQVFNNIDSLDTIDLAQALDIEAGNSGKKVRVLLEVNTSGEPQKFGTEPDSAVHLASMVVGCRNLQLAGLMTVGPNVDDRDRIRGSFRLLRRIFDDIGRRLNPESWSVLSMGMSGDYDIAIEEGATELRLGTALFGPRKG